MKLVNSIISLAAAVAVLPSCVCLFAEADYEAPSDIEVSVGSCEIDRSQLGSDTIVEVPVYINNNCGFISLNMPFELDGRLSFAGDYEVGTRAKKLSGVNIYRCSDSGNAVSACFEVSGRSRYTDNGEIGFLRVNVPANTPAGEYGISMPDSAGDFEIMIFTYNSNDAMFGRECFSALNGGSITVTDSSAERAAEQPDSGNNEEDNNAQQPAAETDGTGDKAPVVTTAESTAATTASTSTAAKTTSTVRSVSSTVTSETLTTASVTSGSEIMASDEAENDLKKEKNRNMLAPILVASLLVIGAAVAFVVKKGGKSK